MAAENGKVYCEKMRLEQSEDACCKMRPVRLECIGCATVPGKDATWEDGLECIKQLFRKKYIFGKKRRNVVENIRTELPPLVNNGDRRKPGGPCIRCGAETTNPGLVCRSCLTRAMVEKRISNRKDESTAGHRVCSICGKEKPLSEFWNKQRACKICHTVKCRERVKRKREIRRALENMPPGMAITANSNNYSPLREGIEGAIKIVGINLSFLKYPELRKWLEELADREVRTLEEQAIYCLLQASKQAGG